MTAGEGPPNPAELLGSEAMRDLLRPPETNTGGQRKVQRQSGAATRAGKSLPPSVLESFDWVILDTPPVLAVTDAVSLIPAVSGLVFVVGAQTTNRRVAAQALDLIRTANPGAIGAVLNRVDLRRNRYYYSRYYGYHGSYYGEAAQPATDTTTSHAPAKENPRISAEQKGIEVMERTPQLHRPTLDVDRLSMAVDSSASSRTSAAADQRPTPRPIPAPAVVRTGTASDGARPAEEHDALPTVTVSDVWIPRRDAADIERRRWLRTLIESQAPSSERQDSERRTA